MLDKAVVALKEDKTKALDMFNKGDGGFKDRDLYVYSANASDGIFTAHPKLRGEQLKDIKGEKGFPLGKEIMEKATEGKMREVTYWWPRPGSNKALESTPSSRRLEIKSALLATTRINLPDSMSQARYTRYGNADISQTVYGVHALAASNAPTASRQ